jgi:cyclohexanone monooxygenase/pentalenolactone D synthase
MSACTPSRINNEGHPEALNPRNGNYGRRFGDWFAYRDRLEQWLEAGTFEGLELDIRSPVS